MSVDSTDELMDILPCVSCGVNADPADGFGKCTCGNEAKRAALQSLIEDRVREAVELFRSDITGWDFDTMVDDDQDSRQICEMVESCSAQTADYVLDTLQLSNSKDSK